MALSTENHQDNMRMFAEKWNEAIDAGSAGRSMDLIEAIARIQQPTVLDAAFRRHGGPGTGKIRSKANRTAVLLHRWRRDRDDDILVALSRTVVTDRFRRLIDRLE